MPEFKEMRLNEGFLVRFGDHWGWVFGGPYADFKPGVRRLAGVKMAAEIKAYWDVSISTKDFSVPKVEAMQDGLIIAIDYIAKGNDLYVGCMGGTGRTGLFMACLIKSLQDAGYWHDDYDAVKAVRRLYRPHAVETNQQVEWVEDFDTTPVVDYILSLAPQIIASKPTTTWGFVVQAVKRFFLIK